MTAYNWNLGENIKVNIALSPSLHKKRKLLLNPQRPNIPNDAMFWVTKNYSGGIFLLMDVDITGPFLETNFPNQVPPFLP